MCEYICDGVILGRFDLNGGVVRELYIRNGRGKKVDAPN